MIDVDALPRRTAHALYALLATSRDLRMPPTAAEICHYDEEAVSVRATAAALREAAARHLCVCAGGYWFAIGDTLHLGSGPFERRFIADTGDDE